MALRSKVRSSLARLARPLFAALDHRLEVLAARLERHTKNLHDDQRGELHRIEKRLDLDVAVVSEHLLGIERVARTLRADEGARTLRADDAAHTLRADASGRIAVARPGEALVVPDDATVAGCEAYEAAPDGTWRPASTAGEGTLRIARLVDRA